MDFIDFSRLTEKNSASLSFLEKGNERYWGKTSKQQEKKTKQKNAEKSNQNWRLEGKNNEILSSQLTQLIKDQK